jgi:hypothetical protein
MYAAQAEIAHSLSQRILDTTKFFDLYFEPQPYVRSSLYDLGDSDLMEPLLSGHAQKERDTS